MELFTEIEFKVEEFDQIEKILHFLTNEGWEIINFQEHSTSKENEPKEIKVIKYFFKRVLGNCMPF